MAVIVLERGHHGRTVTGKAANGGATYHGLVESKLTRAYIAHAEDILTDAGHEVICISDGTYEQRAKRASGYGASIYVACHVNAGAQQSGFATGCVFYDERSSNGAMIANAVAGRLAEVPAIKETKGTRVYPSNGNDWTKRAWATIYSCWPLRPAGICYEPGFIDQPKHASMWTPDGLRLVGQALAQGLLDYLQGQ